MNFYYNPIDIACKSVIGAVRSNEKLKISVFTSYEGELTLLLRRDDLDYFESYPMQKTEGSFFVFVEPLERGLYWYKFSCDDGVLGRNADMLAEIGAEECFQLTVYDCDYATPDWLKGGIIYQIFPDRFCKAGDFEVESGKVKREDWYGDPTFRNQDGLVLNNEFFGGNFEGIRQKLDYLKSLGVNAIYLNPISKAYSSHRYDTGDYLQIDSVLGTPEELHNLVQDAKKLGIRLIFDGVYNHTGADSVYFNRYNGYASEGAYNSKSSPYYDWFTFTEYPDKYDGWWGFDSLPSIKKDSKSFQDFICDKVLKQYDEWGFCGVRLDVVDELSPTFVENIRSTLKKANPDAVVIGEVWEDATNKIAYGVRRQYFCGSELDSVMNYPLKDCIINYVLSGSTLELTRCVREQINNYPPEALSVLMNVLSTHDSPRIITVLGRTKIITDKDQMKYEFLSAEEYEKGKSLAKLAYVLSYTLYGVPSLYYGDEAGLSGNLDPYNRRTFPWGREDKELTEFFIRLGKIRREEMAFATASTNILYAENGVFVFERKNDDEQIFVAVSRRNRDVILNFSGNFVDLFSGKEYYKTVELKQDEFLVLKAKN